MPKPLNKLTDAQLTKKLDKLFSLYIRQRDSDEDGYGNCATCGKNGHYKEMDCGHFIPRGYHSLRWDERNSVLQCAKCNRYRAGEQYLMAQYIDNKYGKGTADLLNELRFKKEAPRRLEKIAMIEKYKELVR